MTLKDFKKGMLIMSGTCKDKEDLALKISNRMYFDSKLDLLGFKESRGTKFFYLVDYKGNVKKDSIAIIGKNNKFQFRYL